MSYFADETPGSAGVNLCPECGCVYDHYSNCPVGLSDRVARLEIQLEAAKAAADWAALLLSALDSHDIERNGALHKILHDVVAEYKKAFGG